MPRGTKFAQPLGRKETLRRYRESPKGKATTAAYYRRVRDRALSACRRRGLAQYGLTPQSYDALLQFQGGCCAVCQRHHTEFRRRFAVDHDHAADTVRGLLCFDCNSSLGKFNDSPLLLRQAASYLEVNLASRV